MFRLEYLKVNGHPQLGTLELFFTEANELKNVENPYKSVIIGANGTGKSYVLRTIIDLFRELNELKQNGRRKKYVVGSYLIKYWIDLDKYSYGNIYENEKKLNFDFKAGMVPGGKQPKAPRKEFSLKKNNKDLDIKEIELPAAILASSIMLTDKYIFLTRPEEFELYKYLGIRASKSSAGTRSYIKNTINLLASSIKKDILAKTLPKVLNFLELENYLFVRYSINRKDVFFKGNLNRNTFIEFVNNYKKKIESRRKNESKTIVPWYAFQHYESLINNNSNLDSIIDFLNRNFSIQQKSSISGGDFFEYDIIENLKKLEDEIPLIRLLEKLNLVGSPELLLKKKKNESYSFEGASSGEAHFLTSIIGIIASITNDSIVLIDEPEISLHPNWQMKYMEFIREVFQQFESCHFIIATHSHFLISDLKGDSSKIIGLKRNDKIEVVDLPMNLDTFGWSAEDVLYNVFNVLSTRNKFVAEDIAKILNELSSGDKNKINKLSKEKYDELLELESALKDNDPLKRVVKTILTKVSK